MTDLGVRPAELKQTSGRDWLTRFGFGAGVSALAGVVSALAGPKVGGLFLAFPAILMASLTLVAQEEGLRYARDEARGATFGTVGLLGFALVVAATATHWPRWLTFAVAVLVWVVV